VASRADWLTDSSSGAANEGTSSGLISPQAPQNITACPPDVSSQAAAMNSLRWTLVLNCNGLVVFVAAEQTHHRLRIRA
jgi:hypothetical protein